MYDIISIFKAFFIPIIILLSLITILVTFAIVSHKKTIKWYLILKLPSNTQGDYVIENMFEENNFNKLIENWTNYKIVQTSLWFQSIILTGGSLFSISLIQIRNNTILIGIIGIILFFIEIIFIVFLILKKISLFFKIKNDLGIIKRLLLIFLLIFIVTIPFWIISFYIIINKPEINFNTLISIYLILTLGMYEYIKYIISFFFPIPANGIYSINELIEELLKHDPPIFGTL